MTHAWRYLGTGTEYRSVYAFTEKWRNQKYMTKVVAMSVKTLPLIRIAVKSMLKVQMNHRGLRKLTRIICMLDPYNSK